MSAWVYGILLYVHSVVVLHRYISGRGGVSQNVYSSICETYSV